MGGWPDGRPGPFLGPFVGLALAAGLLAGAAGAQDCPEPDLAVSAAEGGGIAVALRAPCAPYAAVGIGFGPLEIVEETGLDGSLSVTLPALAGVTEVTVRLGDRSLSVPVPPEATPAPFLAILWPEDGSWGRLEGLPVQRLGFPRAEASVDLVAWAGGTAPSLRIEVSVTDAACGRTLTAALVSADHPAPRTLSLDLPPCSAVGQRVAIPLAP